jgi:hypothetical protein
MKTYLAFVALALATTTVATIAFAADESNSFVTIMAMMYSAPPA